MNAGELKDNVLQFDNTTTSQTDAVSNNIGENEFGKFKDAKSLLSAYNSLQAEFTRRCQRVKELQREVDRLSKINVNDNAFKNLSNGEIGVNESVNNSLTDAEALIMAKRNGNSKIQAEQLNGGNNDLNFDSENSINNSSNLTALPNDIKQKIIREYLNDIENLKPSVTLMSGNGNAIVVPPSKPKSVAEAGEHARHIFKNKEII